MSGGVRPGRGAAFFDLDKTVIAKASVAAFRGPLRDGGLIGRRTLVRAVFAQLVFLHLGASEQRLERIRESVLRLTKGWDQAQVSAIVAETLDHVVEPIIYAEAMDLIDRHRSEGRAVVIVSAAPAEIVEPLAVHLGADDSIASLAALDADGRYTGSMAFYAYGPYKADAMRDLAARVGIDLAQSYAYSDSYTDLPMLEAVGHPVVVNPDRVLAKLARERGWEQLRFVRPVRLRDRVRDRVTPPRPAVAISLGAVCAGVAAVGVGWWLGARRNGRYRDIVERI